MGNNTSNTTPEKGSESVSSIRKPRRSLSLNRSSQLTFSQKIEIKDEFSSQVESCSIEKYNGDSSFLMPTAEVNKDEVIIAGQTSYFRIETASNTTNPLCAVANKDTGLIMSDSIIAISESDFDTDTSTDESSIFITQTSVSENAYSRSNTTDDYNAHQITAEGSRIHCDSRERQEVSQICNTSQQNISDDNCNSKTSYAKKIKTQKDCHISSYTKECTNVTCSIQMDTKKSMATTIKKNATKYIFNSFTKNSPLCDLGSKSASKAVQENTMIMREQNKTLHCDGDHSFSNNKDVKLSWNATDLQESGEKNHLSQVNKDGLKNKPILNTQDTFAQKLLKNLLEKSKRQTFKKMVKHSVSSLPKKQSLVKEQTIVISSDEEAGKPNDKQPARICNRHKSDPSNNASTLNRNPSAACSMRSTMEYNTETKQNCKHQKVADSLTSNRSSMPDFQNSFSFLRSSSNCSLSQEIPYQGEGINQRLMQVHNNPDPAVPILVATSSHASTSSMPCLQRRSSSFYENDLSEGDFPPVLSQHPTTSTLTSSKEASMFSVSSMYLNLKTTDNSSSFSAEKRLRLPASEHNTEIDMYTENTIPYTEHSEENNIHGKINNILDMLNTTDVNVEDQDSVRNNEIQCSSLGNNAEKEISLSTKQHEHEPSEVPHFSVCAVGPAEVGSDCATDLAVVKKEECTNASTDVGNASVYSEISDEIYVLDSDDEEFFMSQSFLGATLTDTNACEQSSESIMERIPQIDAHDKHVEAEDDSQKRLALKQLNKGEKTSVLNQSTYKVVNCHRVTFADKDQTLSDIEDPDNDRNLSDIEDPDNEQTLSDIEDPDNDKTLSDIEDFSSEVAPLSPLLHERCTSLKEHSSNSSSMDGDFPNNYNVGNDDSDMENEPFQLVNTADDHIDRSKFDDDDDAYFLSQVDDVDDSYFAHTQVPYSDEELEQIDDGAKCGNVSVANRTHLRPDDVKTVKQLVLGSSKYFDNKATSSTAFTSCDTQNPFHVETQVYPPSLREEQDCCEALPANLSFDEDTQSPCNNDIHNTAEDTQSPCNNDIHNTAEDTRSPCNNDIHNTAEDTQSPWNNDIHNTAEDTQSPRNNDIHNTAEDTRSPCNNDIYNSAELATSKQDSNEIKTLAGSSSPDLESTWTEENSQVASNNKDPFELMMLEASPKGDMESSYNILTQQKPYDRETFALSSSSSSEDSDCFFSMATQKSSMSETRCKNQNCEETCAVPVPFNSDTHNLDSQVASNNKDPFEQALETSQIKDKGNVPNIAAQNMCKSSRENQDPYNTETQRTDPPEIEKQNRMTETFSRSSSSSSEDSDCFLTQKIFTSEIKNNKLYIKTTFPVSMSITEDKHNSYDTETEENSQSSNEDLENLYNIGTQKMCVPEREDYEPYGRETLAVVHFPVEDSQFLISNKIHKGSDTKYLTLVNEETLSPSLTEDTQDPFPMDTTCSALPNQDLEFKETDSALPLFTREKDDCSFYVQTQKDISTVINLSSCDKQEAVVSAPALEDEDSSEDSQGLFTIRTQIDSCSLITVQNPYDAETIIISSPLTEDTEDPYGVETQIVSPSEFEDYERKTHTASSSLQQGNRGSIKEKDVPAVSSFLNKDKENQCLILTQRDVPYVPDLRPCDKETNVISARDDSDSNERHVHSPSEGENQDKYLLPTQVDYSQHTNDALASTPIEVTQATPIVNKQTYFQSALTEHDPFSTETLVDSPLSSEYKHNNVTVPDMSNKDSSEALQLNQSAQSLDKLSLISKLCQSINRNRPLFTKNLISLQSSHKMSTSATAVKDVLNSVTHNLQRSPYFIKVKEDPSIVREQDAFITEASASFSPNRVKMESLSKQTLIDKDDIKPCIEFFTSEHSHLEDKTASNSKTPAGISPDSAEHISSQPSNHFLGVSLLSHVQNRAPKSNDDRNLFSDQEEVLQKLDVQQVSIHNQLGTSNTLLKNLPLIRDYANKHQKGEAISSHKNNVPHVTSERSQDSSGFFKRQSVGLQEKETPAKRRCMKKVDNHEPASSNKKTAIKRQSKDIELELNLKRMKATPVSSPGSSWITVNKSENRDSRNNKCSSVTKNVNTNKSNNKCSSLAKNVSKPKRKRLKSSEQTALLLTIQVEKAKQMQQHRIINYVSARSDHEQMTSVSDVHDNNDDVEMPSTQDMMNLGLPILSAKLPVSKKHFALGLPSQGRVASEDKDVQGKHLQLSDGRILDGDISVNAKKNNNRKETLPPVLIFNATATDHCTSRAADTSLPTHPGVTLPNFASPMASFSESKELLIDQSVSKNTCHQISESEPNKQIPHTVGTFRSSTSVTIPTTIPTSAHSEVSVNSSHLVHSTPAAHPEKNILPGPNLEILPSYPGSSLQILPVLTGDNLQTLFPNSITAKDSRSSSKGILKTSNVHQGGSKTVSYPGSSLQKLPVLTGDNLQTLLPNSITAKDSRSSSKGILKTSNVHQGGSKTVSYPGSSLQKLPVLTGDNLQTLLPNSITAKDSRSSSKGILKTSNVHQGGSKTVSYSHTEGPLLGKPNHSMPQADGLKQLKESAKPKPDKKLFFLSTVLNWNPSWLKERSTTLVQKEAIGRQSLPELFGSGKKIIDVCFQLRLFYSTFDEYVDITLKLLVLEFWETIFRDWKIRNMQASDILEVHCIQSPKHPDKLHEAQSLVCFEVIGRVPDNVDRRKIPSVGDFLIIHFWGAKKILGKFEEPRLCQQFALVKSVGVKSIDSKLLLQTYKIFESSPALRDKNLLVTMRLLMRIKGIMIISNKLHKIEVIASFKLMERQIDALTNLPSNSLCVPLLRPCHKAVFSHNNVKPDDHLRTKLNREQATAVATILQDVAENPSSPKVFLLQGPPGTGKSHTILALIHQILVKTHFKARICLATPSNAAVDEIAKRIINFSQKLKKGFKISLVRVGNRNKVQHCVKKFMWEELVEQKLIKDAPESLIIELKSLERQAQELQESMSDPSLAQEQKVMRSKKQKEVQAKISKLKKDIEPKRGNSRERYKAKCQILDGAHVICGTLSSLGSDDLRDFVLRNEENPHKTVPFTCLIIDEATQAIEVDCLIPLQYRMSKVVLVGDHEQLPATVLSQLASEKCLARSLFERMALSIIELIQGNASPVMMLTRQYRMHNEILSLPNLFFYDRQLVTDESVQKRKEVIAPYLVFDIQTSRETRDQWNRSVSNMDEASCTAQLCEIVKQKIGDIGVICPYAEQQHAILRCLNQKKLDIEVNTVDSFQGQERDVIILSCVRAQSNPTGIGFLADRKRMNVALTRAKHALYVIGHFETLCTDELWEQLYKNALERKLLVKVTKTADFQKCAESAVLKSAQLAAGTS